MLGIRLGYYTDDPMTAWAIDSMVDYADEMISKCNDWIMPAVFGGNIDETKTDQWFAEYWDKIIPVIEARLNDHGRKFIAGTNRPTIADFKCFA